MIIFSELKFNIVTTSTISVGFIVLIKCKCLHFHACNATKYVQSSTFLQPTNRQLRLLQKLSYSTRLVATNHLLVQTCEVNGTVRHLAKHQTLKAHLLCKGQYKYVAPFAIKNLMKTHGGFCGFPLTLPSLISFVTSNFGLFILFVLFIWLLPLDSQKLHYYLPFFSLA